ncbi:MAG: PAS domain S-box protein [Deltaproteobacteria bacterium]|jgi:PAS domain S-box-containing protein|nr:PAS domain S-box protein [Deltaproteobacteria bacterium]
MVSALPNLGQIVVNPENRVTFANKWVSDITGLPLTRLIGMDFFSLFQIRDQKAVKEALSCAGVRDGLDVGLITVQGHVKNVEMSCVVRDSRQGNPKAFMVLQDVSWHKDMECIAREAHEKLGKIEEMAGCGILVYDTNYRIEFANRLASQIASCPLQELVGKQITRFFKAEDWNYLRDLHSSQSLKQNGCLSVKLPLLRLDGKTIPVEISLDLFQGFREENKTYAVIRDLTQRIQIENELQKTNEFLKKVIHSSVDGIIAADMKGNIIIFNEGAEHLLGYRAEEVIGRVHITKLYPPNLAKEIMCRLRGENYGDRGKLPTMPTTLVAKNKEEIPVNISAAIVYEGEEEMATVGIFTDLRERIKMQQQLDNTYRKLFQSEKLSSLGTLAAGVAHEINNPLNNISTTCQILIEDFKDIIPVEHQERFQWIENQLDKAKNIVRALLEFSREQEFEFKPVYLHEVVSDTLMLIKGEIPSYLELRVELPEQLVLNLDKTRMEQALMNLVMNGVHSIGEEGVLTIRGVLLPESQEVILEVEDTGVGIPKENIPLIFDPFFTTKDAGKGTGLGLSLTYDIIKRHGGSISVTSKVDVGTKFTIHLPLPDQD